MNIIWWGVGYLVFLFLVGRFFEVATGGDNDNDIYDDSIDD